MTMIYSYDAPMSQFCNYGWCVYTVNRKDGKFVTKLEQFEKKNHVFMDENVITRPKMNTILTFRQDEALARFFEGTGFILNTGDYLAFILSVTDDEYKIVFIPTNKVEKYEEY